METKKVRSFAGANNWKDVFEVKKNGSFLLTSFFNLFKSVGIIIVWYVERV